MNKEKLALEFKALLDEYEYRVGENYPYTSRGIDKILATWEENKGLLKKGFENHPAYNGNGQIVLTEKFERPVSNGQVKALLADFQYDEYSRNGFSQLWNLLEFIRETTDFEEEGVSVTPQMVEKSKVLFGEENRACHMHAGQKLSRGLKKLFIQKGLSEIEDFEKLYAKLADALSPQVFQRPFVLSINPIDYLTMSFGYGWTSCHTIDKTDIRGDDEHDYQGCYSSGTLSYMLDSTSIVMYTLSRESDLNSPEKDDKVQRQMCHYSPEAQKIVFGRIYPTSETDTNLYKEFRAIAQRVISECFDITNLWNTIHGPSNCADHTESRGTHYKDYVQYDIGAVSKHQSLVRDLPVVIGHAPICPNCGNEHHVHETIVCNDCAEDVIYCAYCDDPVGRDYLVAYDGTIFCDADCANDSGYYWACDTEEYHYEDNLVYDDYEGEYFYHETIDVYVDGHTFISVENARAYGYEMDLEDNEWYSKDDMIEVCGDWFISEENAIDYGYVRDAYTDELFWPSDGIEDMEEHAEEVEA